MEHITNKIYIVTIDRVCVGRMGTPWGMGTANSQLIASLKPCFYAWSIVMIAPWRLTEKKAFLWWRILLRNNCSVSFSSHRPLYCNWYIKDYSGLRCLSWLWMQFGISYLEFGIPLPLYSLFISDLKFTWKTFPWESGKNFRNSFEPEW